MGGYVPTLVPLAAVDWNLSSVPPFVNPTIMKASRDDVMQRSRRSTFSLVMSFGADILISSRCNRLMQESRWDGEWCEAKNVRRLRLRHGIDALDLFSRNVGAKGCVMSVERTRNMLNLLPHWQTGAKNYVLCRKKQMKVCNHQAYSWELVHEGLWIFLIVP